VKKPALKKQLAFSFGSRVLHDMLDSAPRIIVLMDDGGWVNAADIGGADMKKPHEMADTLHSLCGSERAFDVRFAAAFDGAQGSVTRQMDDVGHRIEPAIGKRAGFGKTAHNYLAAPPVQILATLQEPRGRAPEPVLCRRFSLAADKQQDAVYVRLLQK